MADETEKKPFDVELAKKIIRVVVGEIIDDDKIAKAISYFRTIYEEDIDDADGILYYLQYSKKEDRETIGISDEEKPKIGTIINDYRTTFNDKPPNKHTIIKRIIEEHKPVTGGTRKSAVKRRKSSRRSSKHRKSSRRQLPLRRRRTNKK
jgi:hypothetical protein